MDADVEQYKDPILRHKPSKHKSKECENMHVFLYQLKEVNHGPFLKHARWKLRLWSLLPRKNCVEMPWGKKMLTFFVWTQKRNDSQTASCLGKWNIMATTSGINFWINYNNRHLNLWKTHARVRLMTIFHSCGSRQMADLSNDGTIYGVLGETWVGFNPVVTKT